MRKSEEWRDVVGYEGLCERNGVSKLSEMGVRVIRRLLDRGSMSQRKIAELFRVSQTCIYQIGNGSRWGWVK